MRATVQDRERLEAVDIIAYGKDSFESARERPFLRNVLLESKVLYERPEA